MIKVDIKHITKCMLVAHSGTYCLYNMEPIVDYPVYPTVSHIW